MKIGLLLQNLPKMRQIAMGWDQNCTVTPKCSKSPKNTYQNVLDLPKMSQITTPRGRIKIALLH